MGTYNEINGNFKLLFQLRNICDSKGHCILPNHLFKIKFSLNLYCF